MNNKPLSETKKKKINDMIGLGYSNLKITRLAEVGETTVWRVRRKYMIRRPKIVNWVIPPPKYCYYDRILNESDYLGAGETLSVFSELLIIKKDRTECFPRYKIL